MKGEHTVQVLCELLEVSRSGYYRWESSPPTQRQHEDDELADQIVQLHQESWKSYGAPRVLKDLQARGVKTSKRRCARIMREQGIRGRKKHRRRPSTTDSKHAHPPAPNLLREGANPTGPNQAWMTDITYIGTGEGWLYLAAVLDVWSRKVVGWACAPTLHVSLVLAALAKATRNRKPPRGLLHHSDRGVQYACDEYRKVLHTARMICSMSRKGNCYDNAAMESFWSTLKTETGIDEATPISRRAAELIVFDYIETFYNPKRRHSSLGYLSPVAFEKLTPKNNIKAA
jgi:transposase InsO family protein